MERKQKVRKTEKIETSSLNVHSQDEHGSAVSEGMPAEVGPLHGDDKQQVSGEAASGRSDDDHSDDAVRRRAYELWEQEGSPDGGHERHWHQAEREVRRKD